MSHQNLVEILKVWNFANAPQEIKDRINELMPEWKGKHVKCTQSNENKDKYIFFTSSYENLCCRLDTSNGHYKRLAQSALNYVPPRWLHITTLTGESLLGDPINLVCGDILIDSEPINIIHSRDKPD